MTYSWHRVDGHIPSHSHGRHNDTLVIHRVTPHDEGTYYCVARKNEIRVESNIALVNVNGKEHCTVNLNCTLAISNDVGLPYIC